MFLVNYSSSSDSEDEKLKKQVEQEKNTTLPKFKNNRVLLSKASSLLGKRKLKTSDDEINDDPSQHDGRIRSFKHERGNWATYVYIPVNNNTLEDIQDICQLHLEEKFDFKMSTEMHISLTKTVVLQYHFIESFVETLQSTLQNLEGLTVSFNNLKVYTNAERTRTFLALKVDDLFYEKMLNILHKVDSVMREFKCATFYTDPSFHISILWCTGDCVISVEELLPTILESLKERLPVYFKFDQIYCKSGFKEFYFKLK